MNDRDTLLSNVSLIALMTVASAAIGGPVLAGDLGGSERSVDIAPAVSSINAKVGTFGGNIADDPAAGAFFALAMPLHDSFGMQLDGLTGGADGDPFYGFGGHLFWRDPSRGLLGLYSSYVRWDTNSIVGSSFVNGADVGKAGIEGHLYLDRLTLEGIGAYQFGTKTGVAGKGTVAYYPRDDLRLEIGSTYLEGRGFAGLAGVEWAPMPQKGFSFFGDVSFNDEHDTLWLAGLKFYLSPEDKSLIRRHREDDPDVDLPNDLFQTIKGVCPAGQTLINGFCDGNA